MSKLILLSMIFATIIIPGICAREKNPKKGIKKLVTYMLAFDAFYAFALRFLHGRF